MKNLIASFALAILFIQVSSAQKFVGVTAGANVSTLYLNNLPIIPELSPIANYYVGLTGKISLPSKLAIITDVQFSQKGYQEKDQDETNSLTATGLRLAYIDIIPQLEFRPIPHFAMTIGGNVGIKVKEEVKIADKWEDSSDLELTNNVDFGLLGGLRLYLGDFFVKTSYQLGLSQVFNVDFTDANGDALDVTTNNRTFQVGVGYYFGI